MKSFRKANWVVIDDPVNLAEPVSESELAQVRDWIEARLRERAPDEPIIVERKNNEV